MPNGGLSNAALVGKAGEFLVAGELLRRHIDVAYPAYDGGVDLIAYREHNFGCVVPIQVKTRSGTNFTFQKAWFRIKGLVLVQVWYATTTPEFYIFNTIAQVEDTLGPPTVQTNSWQVRGRWHVGNPTDDHKQRMQAHRNKWDRITDALNLQRLP